MQPLNANGTSYHYFAFKKVVGKMNEGTYRGTGVAKNITGVGFQPEYVLVRTSTVTAGQRAVARSASLSGDSSLNFGLVANESSHIQALLADAFQVGTSKRVNVSPNTYHWVAFGPSGSVGGESLLGPTAIELISLDATSYPGQGVLVSWQTGWEVDNLGFHVYREQGGQRVRVTPGLVAGSAGLPHYMVPAAFVLLDSMPLTSNGKVDRAALQALPISGATEDYVAPGTHTEVALAGIWAELLNFDERQVSAQANFFDLGGHSLLAVRMLTRIRERLSVELSVRDVFDVPDLAGLARRIDKLHVLASMASARKNAAVKDRGVL